MDDEKGFTKDARRTVYICPSWTTFIVYSSIVILLAAVLIPLEYHFGMLKLYRQLDSSVSSDMSLQHYVLNKLGYADDTEDNSGKEHVTEEKMKEFKVESERHEHPDRVFTKEELRKYSGDSPAIYLAILGKVFDVTKGKRHYGKGGSYSFFAGIDGSRAYVTGEFNEKGLRDNIEGLEPQQYLGLMDWLKVYEKDYIYIGKVSGYFYDADGNALEGVNVYEKGVKEGEKNKANDQKDKILFPECNSQWTPETGSNVWCALKSGGVSRDWIGYPRKCFKPGQATHRCACVKKEHLADPRFKEYKDCPVTARTCKVVNNN